MFASCHHTHRLDERVPRFALTLQHPPSVGRELVEPPPAFAGLLDPGAFDPAALLEPVEQRIERVDVKHETAGRTGVDERCQLVAMARPGFEKGQEQQLSRAFLELAVQGSGIDVCHRQVSQDTCMTSGNEFGWLETWD